MEIHRTETHTRKRLNPLLRLDIMASITARLVPILLLLLRIDPKVPVAVLVVVQFTLDDRQCVVADSDRSELHERDIVLGVPVEVGVQFGATLSGSVPGIEHFSVLADESFAVSAGVFLVRNLALDSLGS